MTMDFSKGDRRAIIAFRLMWLPVCILIAGQLYLVLFQNWLSWYVSFFSIGVGAILGLVPIIIGIMSLVSKTQLKRKAFTAVLAPILVAVLSSISWLAFGV